MTTDHAGRPGGSREDPPGGWPNGRPDGWLGIAEPSWTPVDLPFLALDRTFLGGDPAGDRLQVRYFRGPEDGTLFAKVVFGIDAQGPPGHVHGGAMASVLDESMGGAAWLAGHPVVAAQLNLTFLQLLPVRTPCLVQAAIAGVEGRKVHTTGQIGSPDQDRVYCRATGLFIVLDPSALDKLPPAAAAIVDRLRRAGGG